MTSRRSFFRSLAGIAGAAWFSRKITPEQPPFSKTELLARGGDPAPAFNPKAYFGTWQFVSGPMVIDMPFSGTFPSNAGETIRK